MTDLLTSVVENVEILERDLGGAKSPDLVGARKWVEALRAGKILFYDHQEVQIGHRDIDWTGAHVAHQEWPAQLNRFFWLDRLAAVYRETGDETLAEIARSTIEDWIDQHDYSADKPPAKGDNTLNVSIRLGQGTQPGWWGTVKAFAGSPHYDEAFLQRMLESTRGQLACLQNHLSPAGNWRISHLDCLLFCGMVVPGLEAHAAFAVRHLNEAFYRQIHPDGSHEEHNPSYHGWMCRLYTRLWRLGRARPELGLSIDTKRAARMWDYMVCSTAPDGGACGLHDGGVWSPGPGRILSMSEREAFLRDAGLLDDPEWDLEARPSRYFESAGQVFLRDGWSADSTFLVFDATRWGGAHCHLSRLSVNLYAGGRMLLCDPGVFSYEMSDPYASHGKTTRAHNTITVGGLSQTEVDPDTRIVHIQDDLAVVASRYGGGYFPGNYTWGWGKRGPGTYGVHDRVMLWLPGRCALVFDRLQTEGGRVPYAAHWQLPAGDVRLDEAGRRAQTVGEGHNLLIACLTASDELTLSVREGEEEPIQGWLPDRHRNYHPAPMLEVSSEEHRPTSELVTLLLPFDGTDPPDFRIETFDRSHGEAYGYRLCWLDGVEHVIAASPALMTQIDRCGPFDTDAALAVVAIENGSPARAFILDGSFVDLDGSRMIDEPVSGVFGNRDLGPG